MIFVATVMGCSLNSKIYESEEISKSESTPQLATLRVDVAISDKLKNYFTLDGNYVVEMWLADQGEDEQAAFVCSVNEYDGLPATFTFAAQPSTSCSIRLSKISVPEVDIYEATLMRCAIESGAISQDLFMSGGTYSYTVVLDNSTYDESGSYLLPTPILFTATVEEWQEE